MVAVLTDLPGVPYFHLGTLFIFSLNFSRVLLQPGVVVVAAGKVRVVLPGLREAAVAAELDVERDHRRHEGAERRIGLLQQDPRTPAAHFHR